MHISLKSVSFSLSLGFVLLVSSVSHAQAQVFAETWISGTVVDGANNPVNGGQVLINCNGTVKTVGILANGSYAASFPQSQCKAGNGVTATASTDEGSGSNSTSVQNTVVNGPIVDLDIAVIDITVPEFGLIGGFLTGAVGIAGYFFMRQRAELPLS